jgi:hypothetical protein
MSQKINTQNTPLFQNLSDKEQETVTGGNSHHSPMGVIFYQEQQLLSYANTETNFSDGVNQFSHSETALYSLSNKRFLFIPLFRLGNSRKTNKSSMNILLGLFSRFIF